MKKIGTLFCLATLCFGMGVAQTNTSYNLNSVPISGAGNSAFGGQSQISTTGNFNTSSGYQSMQNNTSGSYNTASGYQSLKNNTTGGSNTALGYMVLNASSTAEHNTGLGFAALYGNSTGGYNTAVGTFTLFNNKTGTYNTSVGAFASTTTNNLTNATSLGYGAMVSESNAIQLGNTDVTKVYVGSGTTATLITGGLKVTGGTIAAGQVLTSDASGNATWQSPAGGGSGWSLTGNAGTSAASNFIGTTDLAPLSIRVNNVPSGKIEGDLFGNNGTYFGYQSGNYTIGGGVNATAFGYKTLANNYGGAFATAVGVLALNANTTGGSNTAVGAYAMQKNTTGHTNTGVGYYSLGENINGAYNVALGSHALAANVSGGSNTGLGMAALNSNTSGQANCAVGRHSLQLSTSGNYNAALGTSSLLQNTTGSENVALGNNALSNNTTGFDNSGIGFLSNVSTSNLSNATAIGANTIVDASNKIRLGATTVTVIEGQVPFTNVSDGRFKTNISEKDVKGLEFITKLRPVVYNLDTRKMQEFLTKNLPDSLRNEYLKLDFEASTAVRQSGFIAQEVEKAAQDVDYNFNGVHVPVDENDNYGLAYSQFVVPLVKGMQEQQAMIEAQNELLTQQQKEIDALKEMVSEMLQGNSDKSQTGSSVSPEIGSIQVFPNPSASIFSIRLSNIEAREMQVVNVSGQIIQTIAIEAHQNSYQVDLSGNSKGIYFLNLVNAGEKLSKKLILE